MFYGLERLFESTGQVRDERDVPQEETPDITGKDGGIVSVSVRVGR